MKLGKANLMRCVLNIQKELLRDTTKIAERLSREIYIAERQLNIE